MERIAIISDIHGNMPALEAVLSDIEQRKIERIYCLGDIAGKGPSSSEAVDRIKETCDVVVKGNWDHFMIDVKDNEVIEWHREKLGKERLSYLESLPHYVEFYMSGKLIRLCHASPHDLFHRVHLTTDNSERIELFKPTETLETMADVIGYGDIHSAHIDRVDGRMIFNTGSVGNPLDFTQASYSIIEGNLYSEEESSFSVTSVRVPYDIELAVLDAEESDMPELEAYTRELRTAVYRGRH